MMGDRVSDRVEVLKVVATLVLGVALAAVVIELEYVQAVTEFVTTLVLGALG